MAPLLAALLVLILVLWRLVAAERSAGFHDSRNPGDLALVAVVLALPFLYASLVLWSADERLESLHLTYVGKRLAWGPGLPLTVGGMEDPETEATADLRTSLLDEDVLTVAAADEDAARSLDVEEGTPVLRLADKAPAVSVDGELVNVVPLEEGDRIVLGSPAAAGEEPPVALVFTGQGLEREGRVYPLPGRLKRFLQPARVHYLPDLLGALAPEVAPEDRDRYRSALVHEDGRWSLLLRDASLGLRRGEDDLADLTAPRPAPEAFDLELEVVWGAPDSRRLRTIRRDRLVMGSQAVEVRFREPQRRSVPLGGATEPVERGLVVPSSIDRRPDLIELDERSERFHGLVGTLRYDPDRGAASLEYLGGRWEVEAGELYGLGEGDDLLLLRFEYGRHPGRVLLDLALFGLFSAVFLGRILLRSPSLTAVFAPVGLLLAHRLLFSFRAATEPPGHFVRAYGEARLAVWLIPALLLFGWTAAVLLTRVGESRTETSEQQHGSRWVRVRARWKRWWARLRPGFRPLRWPLAGLVVAALGCGVTVPEAALVALLPVVLAGILLLLYAWAVGPGASRVRRWREEGWGWELWALPALGLGMFLFRLAFLPARMPEALRIPGRDFRLLWTVFQLPLGALALGLTCHLLLERLSRENPGRAVRTWWLGGIAGIGGFIALAFGAVGWVAEDRGLLIVHALPAVFALLLLVTWPSSLARPGARPRTRWFYAAGFLAAALPLVLILVANLRPVPFVTWIDQVSTLGESSESAPEDLTARLRASPEQQRFRLVMLANPEALREVGVRPSEQAAVQYQTIQQYAHDAGFAGRGFASSDLPAHVGITYLNDLMPMAFVLADFGTLGMLGLALTYLTVLAGAVFALRFGGGRWRRQGAWVAAMALLAFALPGLYMILANLNLVLFTGKNASLLALNSTSDVLQSGALLALAALGLALRGRDR